MLFLVFSFDNRNEWILSWLSLLRFSIPVVLPLNIKLSRGRFWVQLNGLGPPHICTCSKPWTGLPRMYFVFSEWRWQIGIGRIVDNQLINLSFVLLIFVELLTINCLTFFSYLHGRHLCFSYFDVDLTFNMNTRTKNASLLSENVKHI